MTRLLTGRRLTLAVGTAVASLTAGALPAPLAGASVPPSKVAFYTYQAPGGASTAGHRVIALTFDDGPGPYTPQVLAVLERYHVPATFFEIGNQVIRYPRFTKMLAAAGYPVENHTWSHPDLNALTPAEVADQIARTQASIEALTHTQPSCLRPPYDLWNRSVLQQIANRRLTAMSYSIDPRDWSLPGTDAIVARVLDHAVPGAVIDFHDGGGSRYQTVAALPGIITGLKARGYRFVAICGAQPKAKGKH